ncbi:MAG TPA: hypothetical protein VGN97_18945 [Mesorhizobium sp.]|jgi:hypothetical protein|nr:hypothetical protein [Mesorhizobium sp.]
MMSEEDDVSEVSAAFPLYMRDELEVAVNRMGYVIGVNKSYPARLREMVSAAAITYQLQNASIDHVRRTYLKNLSYEEDPGGQQRLDRPYKRACIELFSASVDFLKQYPPVLRREPLLGEWIGDLTIIRCSYSFERAFAEADKGALYECVAIARMILEQISWVLCVRLLDDVDVIASKRATKSVGEAARQFPFLGRLYGWMSEHAHWAYGAHLKAITHDEDRAGAMLASSEFKAIAYAMLIVLTEAYRKVVNSLIMMHRTRDLTDSRRVWSVAASKFRPLPMVKEIARLSEGNADVFSLLKMLQDGPRHG